MMITDLDTIKALNTHIMVLRDLVATAEKADGPNIPAILAEARTTLAEALARLQTFAEDEPENDDHHVIAREAGPGTRVIIETGACADLYSSNGIRPGGTATITVTRWLSHPSGLAVLRGIGDDGRETHCGMYEADHLFRLAN
jgi:hypothetical protein